MVYYLVFKDTLFSEINNSDIKESDLAILSIDGTESTLYFNESIKLIDKLTAQRQVNSIVKSGFLLGNNLRIGANSNLKVVVGSLPSQGSQKPSTKVETDVSSQVQKTEISAQLEQKQEEENVEPVSEKETYDRPIIFTVEKEQHDNEESSNESMVEDKVLIPELKSVSEESTNKFSIQDVLREEKEKLMSEPKQEVKTRSYDEVIEYFWKELFGQVYSSWDSLPTKAKNEFFQTLEIKELSDQEVQELFSIRHENNIEAFKQKLNDFTEKNKK